MTTQPDITTQLLAVETELGRLEERLASERQKGRTKAVYALEALLCDRRTQEMRLQILQRDRVGRRP